MSECDSSTSVIKMDFMPCSTLREGLVYCNPNSESYSTKPTKRTLIDRVLSFFGLMRISQCGE